MSNPPSAVASTGLISSTPAWLALEAHAHSSEIAETHLRDMLTDQERVKALQTDYDGIVLDWSRQRVNGNTMNLLFGQI